MTDRLALRKAMEARDHAAVLDAFASDAVVRSPITGRFTFSGREQLERLFAAVLEVFNDIEYTDELRNGDTAVLVAKATVDGTPIELVDHLLLDADGKIRELTVFFRPLPAIAVAARALGSSLLRAERPWRARIVSVVARPLILFTRSGDALALRLVLRTL
jgi:hypothetical protein